MDSLVKEPIPGLPLFVFKRNIAVRLPFFEKRSSAIFLTKVGTQSFFKTATEDHRCPCLFFLPAIQVTVPIAARAAKILADLRVAIDHHCLPAHRRGPSRCNRVPPSPLQGRRHRGSGKSDRSELYKRFGRLREVCKAFFHRP